MSALAALVFATAAVATPAVPSILDVRVVDAGGRMAALRDVVGDRPTLLVLWASHCAPCRAEVPVVNRAMARFAGLRVLGVALETEAPRVRDAHDTWEMHYETVWLAPDQDDLVERLLPNGIPSNAFVGHGSVKLVEHLLDDDMLAREVPPLLESAPPAR